MNRLLAVLARNGIPVKKLDGPSFAELDGRCIVPLGGNGALVFEKPEDLARAIDSLAQELLARESHSTREAAMLRVLLGTYDENDPACHAAQIEPSARRCAVVMQSRDDLAPLARALQELFPADGPDAVLATANGQMTVVKRMDDIQESELVELCLALQDTLRSDEGMRVVFGIGGTRGELLELADSYEEALSAIRVGVTYHPAEQVFLYSAQTIERFLQQVPQHVLKEYHEMLFGERNERLLNEEMLHTIECFFSCDLNLSETARRLYIHRNTLVYRLDKLQKAVGLDLRKFDDAVVYKLLRMMGVKSRAPREHRPEEAT